jgi:purine-binding chemotaxis protein CheW
LSVTENKQFASFFVDDLLFGIEATKVREVTNITEITPVPLSPRTIRGLVNLRGQIVTVIDMRRCLQFGERSNLQIPVHLILGTSDGYASLLVDRAGDVLEVSQETFEFPPETLQGCPRNLIQGAYKLEDRLLLVLDIEKILNGTVEMIPAHSNAAPKLTVGLN